MKKRILLSLLLFLSIFMVAGCGKKEEEKEIEYYEFNDLKFKLPSEYEKVKEDFYQVAGNGENITVEFKIEENTKQELKEYINNESDWIVDVDSLEGKKINGTKWLKTENQLRCIIYYAKVGKDIYGIQINPATTTVERINDTYTTLEETMHFK